MSGQPIRLFDGVIVGREDGSRVADNGTRLDLNLAKNARIERLENENRVLRRAVLMLLFSAVAMLVFGIWQWSMRILA